MFEGLKIEIEYLTNAKNNLWLAGLSSFGAGVSVLAFDIPIIFKLSGFLVGFVFSIIFLLNYLKKGVKIERRINYIKKKGG